MPPDSTVPDLDRAMHHPGVPVVVTERPAAAARGLVGMLVLAACLAGLVTALHLHQPRLAVLAAVCLVLVSTSLIACQPGHAWVLQYFGRYVGTLRRPGLAWVLPLTTRRRISVRARNFETARLRVNDAEGNPIEIAAVVVWQVADTAKAVYAVDDYQTFVAVQAESALRQIATGHPYDISDGARGVGTAGIAGTPGAPGMTVGATTSLRGSTEQVADELWHEVGLRVALAGVEVIEARISHLAYAPEMAQALLRRQQAGAVIDARSRIVEGAVGMVEMALNRLNDSEFVTLDDERKAAMVSNLMVVLCSEAPTAPVVNTGTLYSA